MKITILWVATSCTSDKAQRFEAHRLHLQGENKANNKRAETGGKAHFPPKRHVLSDLHDSRILRNSSSSLVLMSRKSETN
jgi:hypothetical protein